MAGIRLRAVWRIGSAETSTRTIQAKRSVRRPVMDSDGPVFEGGLPVYETVQVAPMDVVTTLPTWESMASETVALTGEDGKTHRYSIQDLLNADCTYRKAEYLANHSAQLEKSPIECLVFAVSTNHEYNVDAQARRNEDGSLAGQRGPGNIPANSGNWHLAKAGIAIGVRGANSKAWFAHISASDVCKAICGTGIKPHFYAQRVKVGQEYSPRAARISLPSPVAAGLVANDDNDLPF